MTNLRAPVKPGGPAVEPEADRSKKKMAETANTIEVSILGRTYRIACEEPEREALLRAVAYLDGKMGDIRHSGKVAGTERIAVMAALNIAHEFLTTKLGPGFDIGQAKRRIDSIEARLDEALAKQEQLF